MDWGPVRRRRELQSRQLDWKGGGRCWGLGHAQGSRLGRGRGRFDRKRARGRCRLNWRMVYDSGKEHRGRSLPPSLSLDLSLDLSLSLSRSLSLSLSIFLSIYQSLDISISHYLTISLSIFRSLSLSLSFVSLSRPHDSPPQQKQQTRSPTKRQRDGTNSRTPKLEGLSFIRPMRSGTM